MMQTKWADKAGTTDYVLSAWCRIPLDDPNCCGNFGLDGYDEEAIGHDYRSEAAAKRATAALLAEAQQEFPGCTVDWVKLTERRWDEELIEDREYGVVRSAEQWDVRHRYGYPDESGKVKWEEWTDANA